MRKRTRTTHLVFHTAAVMGDPSAASIKRDHVDRRGWSDIGYHYVIRKDGTVEKGRREDLQGAHCYDGGMNPRSVGVCFSGHHGDRYHGVEGEHWTPEQEASWLTLAAKLVEKYGIDVSNVIGHVEAGAAKACPGDNIDCPEVRARLAAHLAGGGLTPAAIEDASPLAPVAIRKSVGDGGKNAEADVRAVQRALKEASRLTLDARLDPGPIDGDSGVGTEGAIERFQRRLGIRRPDARIDPNGYTLKRLNALLGVGRIQMTFPFEQSSAWAYEGADAGMRAFGSRRRGGRRAHAGCDIYMPDFTPVLAVADGVVTRSPYYFYNETYAVEIDHGGFVARYGEIAPEDTWLVQEGDPVARGQQVGRVGILTRDDGTRMDLDAMMLHLEMYDKTETGKLTRAKGTSARHTNGVPFYRRRDLIDPTGFLKRAPLPVSG